MTRIILLLTSLFSLHTQAASVPVTIELDAAQSLKIVFALVNAGYRAKEDAAGVRTLNTDKIEFRQGTAPGSELEKWEGNAKYGFERLDRRLGEILNPIYESKNIAHGDSAAGSMYWTYFVLECAWTVTENPRKLNTASCKNLVDTEY